MGYVVVGGCRGCLPCNSCQPSVERIASPLPSFQFCLFVLLLPARIWGQFSWESGHSLSCYFPFSQQSGLQSDQAVLIHPPVDHFIPKYPQLTLFIQLHDAPVLYDATHLCHFKNNLQVGLVSILSNWIFQLDFSTVRSVLNIALRRKPLGGTSAKFAKCISHIYFSAGFLNCIFEPNNPFSSNTGSHRWCRCHMVDMMPLIFATYKISFKWNCCQFDPF